MKGGQSDEPHFIGVKYVRLAESTIQKLKKGKATMKKILSLMLAFVLVLSMSVTAFAADGQGSITITNATIGQLYSVYKLFDATYNADAEGNANAVSYSIDDSNQFFAVLFGADGTTPNNYFNYDAVTGTVTKKSTVNDTELIAYVTGIVNASGTNYTPDAGPVEATTTEVEFDNLDYGYYIIKSTLGGTVTINSNTPDVEVIDKNQQGGTNFNKLIKTGEENGAELWGDNNSACFGETVKYKITFNATNYDGANQTQFYSVYDTTGTAISPSFSSFTVKVGNQTLTKGYYLGTGEFASTSEKLGTWDGDYKTAAEWYLVRSNEDEFRISIPWMTNHTLNGDGTNGYSLSFGEGAASKFESPVAVEITYEATVEDNATIGGASYNTAGSNNINTAHVKWYFHGGTDSTINDTVHTYVYGIGILKEDSSTAANLAGAEFEVYIDEACTQQVKFVTTGIKGVYSHDEDGEGATNKVVSQLNGKIVLLGLEDGDYYLKEVKAPDGYNALSAPVKIEVGEGKSEDFSVYANTSGEVADTEQDMEGYTKYTFGVTKATVGNSKGVELPSTGGKGTTMLITFGSLIAIGFAVFLITHKKMSIYTD